MTAAEIRDLNFAALRDSLEDRREAVYRAFARCGGMTTRAKALTMGWDVLSVRPRVTELVQMGLLVVSGCVVSLNNPNKRETTYRAATLEEWEAWRAEHFPQGGQLQMGLNQQGALTA